MPENDQMTPAHETVQAGALEIAYLASGPERGIPVVLLHGFPDDAYAYEATLTPLAELGCRLLVPWLRGYGPTRFLTPEVPRSGQQAALGADLRAFLDALDVGSAILVGYDWGGRAACVVAALWPERCRGLVTAGGYNVQDLANANRPGSPADEYKAWYQWYFNTERGRAGLEQNRRDLCRLLWQLWSPTFAFDDATFDRTAASFDNPDFVDVVIHSYRHRRLNAPGDPALEAIEARLAAQPRIAAPTVVLAGEADGVDPPSPDDHDAVHFTGPYERRLLPRVGHFVPREAPDAVVAAVRSLLM
jgi:pimeloyl-ACP methyl ester carboxylesterase